MGQLSQQRRLLARSLVLLHSNAVPTGLLVLFEAAQIASPTLKFIIIHLTCTTVSNLKTIFKLISLQLCTPCYLVNFRKA